jgi:hypothetical protein
METITGEDGLPIQVEASLDLLDVATRGFYVAPIDPSRALTDEEYQSAYERLSIGLEDVIKDLVSMADRGCGYGYGK